MTYILFDEDLMICIEMLHIRRNLNRPATQASQRAQMARLKQQEQMETVEAQARKEARGKQQSSLHVVTLQWQAVTLRKQSEPSTESQNESNMSRESCQGAWRDVRNMDGMFDMVGWMKQHVRLHLLCSLKSMVHWSESSMSGSHSRPATVNKKGEAFG